MSVDGAGPLRVLLVDDDEVDRMAVRRALRAGDTPLEVREAADLSAALAALRDDPAPDCVFLDLHLPGGDGARVLREARARGMDVPVVVLTGQEDTRTAVELMRAGATDYLPKRDLAPGVLERVLHAAVRIGRAEAEARRAREALRESEARLRRISESGMIGLLFWDVGGRVMSANDAFLQMVGYDRADLEAGRIDWRAMTPPEWHAVDEAAVEQVRTRGVVDGPFEKEFVRSDGTRIPVLLSAAAFDGTRDQGVTLVLDMTARRRAETDREQALASRTRFYAAMSHELRTPINAVLGYNDLLLSGVYGPMEPRQREGVERSQRAARHLLELVNDVLDLSKVEAGKTELVAEPVRLPALVQDLLATVRPMAEERGCEIRVSDEACALEIVTDPRRVLQILLNLLSNAVKFGDGRPVDLVCADQPDGGVVVEVTDRGPGIAAGDLARIFEEFVQLPSASRGGTGLGLAISRRLAELLGGSLSARSVPGEGSTFRLRLPAAAPPQVDAAAP